MKEDTNEKEVSKESKKKVEAKKPTPKKEKLFSSKVLVGFTFGTGKNSKSYKPGDDFHTKNENTFNYFRNSKKYIK